MNRQAFMNGVRGASLSGVLFLVGCAQDLSSPEVMKLARNGGAIVSLNGLGTDGMARVSGDISKKFGMLHVNGDQIGDKTRLFEVLRAADDRGLYFTYHSMGSVGAYDLVKECERRGIDVQVAYSLDAFVSNRFPKNVKRVQNIFSSLPYIFGKQTTFGGLSNSSHTIPGSDHYFLPFRARGFIEEDIRRNLSERLGYAPGAPARHKGKSRR
jgi:hypothetical protein